MRELVREDALGGVAVPLEASGNMRLYLRARDQSLYIDGNDLYRGRIDPAVFKDKLVLISLSVGDFSGLLDTPLFGVAMTAELQAQMIEQMLSGDYLIRPDWGVWAEIGLVLLLGLAILWLVPALRPIWAIPVAFGVAVFAVPLSLLAFAGPGLVFDGLGVAVSLMIVGASAFGSALVERDHQHRAMELTLAVERAAKSRLEGELDVARRIQMGLLPEATSTPVPSLEIACHIAPARVVGGDFYDHIVRTDGQVFFLIADVSGKGVPASLFMALSKSLWKSAALRRDDLGEIQSLANHEITRDNSDHMFVTGVACMFDPVHRTLQYCGAGHDMPILARPGESAISLPEAAGPPLGLQDGPSFPVGQIPLAPGDLVCLFTDGLTEAELTCLPDGGALPGPGPMYFGAEGVALGLEQAAAQGLSAQQTVAHINALLGRVTEDADQTDDRTLVVIRAL